MPQEAIDTVGSSEKIFAKAAENPVAEAAKTVRSMKWARVAGLEMVLDGKTLPSTGQLLVSTLKFNGRVRRTRVVEYRWHAPRAKHRSHAVRGFFPFPPSRQG
jgi:flavin-binding protein dodecin